MIIRQLLQGREYVFADKIPLIALYKICSFINHHRGRTQLQSLGCEVVCIETRPFQCKKEIPRIDFSRVCANAGTVEEELVKNIQIHFLPKICTQNNAMIYIFGTLVSFYFGVSSTFHVQNPYATFYADFLPSLFPDGFQAGFRKIN